MRIYIAGPIGANDEGRADRISVAMGAAARLLIAGLDPFCPHLWVAAGASDELVNYERWMAHDFAFLDVCQALLRLPGRSPGADREVARARTLGLSVFHDETELVRWARSVEVPRGERCPDEVHIVNHRETARGGGRS